MTARTRTVPIALAVAVAAAAVVAVVQSNRLSAARHNAARLEARVERLEAQLADRTPPRDPSDDVLGSVPEGDLGDMFGGDVLDCLTSDTALAGVLGDGSARAGGNEPRTAGARQNARAQVRAIARSVERVRGLEFERRVRPVFLSPDEVARRAARLFLSDYPRATADAEARLLAALGAIPEGLDLRRAVTELLESQVAGFYVPETEKLVVPSDDPSTPLTAAEKVVLAHELEHALAHQSLGLPVARRPDVARLDENLAALALVEGDATLAMQRYALHAIPIFEQFSMLSDPLITRASAALEGVPHYLARQLGFPYVAGLEFVCDRYRKRKWTSIVGLVLVEHPGESGLCVAVAGWYEAAFPDDRNVPMRTGEALARDGVDRAAVLVCDGADVRLGIAPDVAAARRITR